MVKQVDTTLD